MSENKLTADQPLDQPAGEVCEASTQSDQVQSDQVQRDEARRAQTMLMQRRQVLKAAALAAPLLVTLRARSVYAGGGHHSQMGSTGINYGPGSYGGEDDGEIHEPGKKKKKKKWWWGGW